MKLKTIIAKITKFYNYVSVDAKASWITASIFLVLMWTFAIWLIARKY